VQLREVPDVSDNLGVVVGIDDSVGGLRALRWALAESERHRLPLHIVNVWSWRPTEIRVPHPVMEDVGQRAHELVDRAVADVRTEQRRVSVEGLVLNDRVVPGLLALAEAAELIVVGSHSGPDFAGMPLGSVACRVATHAACPAVVVRPRVTRPDLPVVLGVDGSAANQAAVGFAFHEADVHEVPIQALLCWRGDSRELPTYAEAEARLAEVLMPWRDKHPEVHVVSHVLLRHPRNGLIAASRDASLLVVGSRGYGAVRARLLGSVSSALLQHADSPIAIVRSDPVG
jgi:nucleotide-binding universal stress UspA family protein